MCLYNQNLRECKGRSLIGFPDNFCVVDIETTGLNPITDSIIEIGAIKFEGGVMVDSFDSLLQPDSKHYNYYVSSFITNLTGITNEMLEKAPPTYEVIEDFYRFLGDSIIVGYNVNFDVNFLYHNFERVLDVPLTNDFIDILRMAKRLYPEMAHHRLGDMVCRFGLVNEHAHRALSDCEVTAECFAIFKREAEYQFDSLEAFLKTYPKKCRMVNAL